MRILSTILCSVLLLTSIPVFTSCGTFGGGDKIAPIAEGQDSIVVNAERAQRSTLDIYDLVTQWEFKNRATLPAEVSRAVDAFRKEFPPAWKQSRRALADYKKQKGPNSTDVERITSALLVAQANLLQLRDGASATDATRAMNALGQLISSIRVVFNRTPSTTTSTNR